MDFLGHNCLKEGAKASLANLVLFEHLNDDDFEAKIKSVRAKAPNKSILVVTESLFSMDSDCPDLDRIQRISKEHNATLLVDSAHDMYGTGPRGRGHVSERIKDFSNVIVIGSGSKCLASNFGYCVTGNKKIIDMIETSCASWSHSDVLPPARAALVSHNIKVMGSERGFQKRDALRRNTRFLTKRLQEEGFETIGFPSPIVLVFIGSEFMSRVLGNFLYGDGVIVNPVEYPAVATGQSRLRLQIQSSHTEQMLEEVVQRLKTCYARCQHFLETDPFAINASEYMIKELQKDFLEKEKAQEQKEVAAKL